MTSTSKNIFINDELSSANKHISVQNMTLKYSGKKVIEICDLNINRDEITAFVGPSGCGKSSFLFSLNRLTDLINGCDVTGSIIIDGTDILNTNINITDLRKNVGLIFQKPNPFPLSIINNIDLPLKEHGVKVKAKRMLIIQKVLKDVGLWAEVKDRMNQPALSLSGGQQQRLCIARAIALEPKILLMDEPCSALDPISSGVVEDLILKLKGNYTILIVTHNLSQAKRISDNTALFWTKDGVGSIVEYGDSMQFFENPKNEITSSYIKGHRG